MSLIALITGMMLELIVYCATVIIFSFTIWMFVDAAKQDRFWWIVIILGVPVIGPAVYYFTEKKHEYAKAPVRHIHQSQTESQHEVTPLHHEHHRKGDVEPTVAIAEDVEEKDKKEDTKEVKVTEIV